jgi:hypothetical protein
MSQTTWIKNSRGDPWKNIRSAGSRRKIPPVGAGTSLLKEPRRCQDKRRQIPLVYTRSSCESVTGTSINHLDLTYQATEIDWRADLASSTAVKDQRLVVGAKWSQSPAAIGDGRSGPCSQNGERITSLIAAFSCAINFITEGCAQRQSTGDRALMHVVHLNVR